MSTFRTSRARLVAAAATTVLAALSLTACNDGTGTNDEGAAASVSADSSADSATPGAGTTATPKSTGGSTGSSGSGSTSGSTSGSASGTKTGTQSPATKAPATKAPSTSGGTVTCEGSNTKTVAAPLTRPVNHLLLTVTNTGDKTCFLYGYPSARFTDAQSEPPVIDESQPQAVVTLKPGQSGFATVSLSAADGSGGNGRTVKSLTVYFYGRSMSGSVGAAAHPQLPAKGLYIDDSVKVSYWQQSMDDAINW
ncbi:DUF4232 domain-containing protein [Streptomyces cylindrosporus]|uniref:DUF4232 domain-containing protein n=1 Tax=Streptomyces cylindrosporus TaxID=2927583 RepID=A0ABS9YCG1_9ACTN|nr:DUF4232 domain-containing protein [Streptomyces cylindrosporus]MCI3274909.1 DUF4232 domain-containing protein [Streptomyces cylindrosporus]